MTVRQSLACACLVLGAGATAPVLAQTATPGADSPTAASDSALFATPVSTDALATFRGGAQHSSMTLDGVTSDNSARNVSTGSNSIDSGSFANMSGLPIVIQNSGANVLIQNAVILNLQMN